MNLTLTWINRNAGEDGTRIYRSESPMDESTLPEPLATVGPGVTAYLDTTAERNKLYYYRFGIFKDSNVSLSGNVPILALPEYGPGPQTLRGGNFDVGFFGEVEDDELFTGTALSSELEFTSGTLTNDQLDWLKVAYEGKVLFIPRRVVRTTVSWLQLYQAGLVNGEDGPGIVPTGQEPVNQLRIVSKNGYRFKVRLLTMNGPQSEWERIIYRFTPAALSAKEGGNFKTYVDLFKTSATNTLIWGQEYDEGSGTSRRRNTNSSSSLITNSTAVITTTSSYYWLPVLEYLP